ncbi:iron-containing alcohol dehydrogenase [Fluviispira vulneris]|uniref:iron-containing alcohol dehydrogenase n=1 Tax=Fluviispira vulneris TaxID=2763012 RepID=UPI0016485C8C|nr:iron-containing alcohol dehydrogenase [Fluviispira vulneris]
MSIFFEKITQVFTDEKIDYSSNKNIPIQFCCNNYEEFSEKITQVIPKNKGNKVFILHDGKDKKSDKDSNTNILEKIIETLSDKYSIIEKNLSTESKCKSDEIHASEYFLEKTTNLIFKETDCEIYIALGSGTITDLLKHSLFLNKPNAIFISIPTAMTVTAFTSSFSVVDISGAKRTRQSKDIYATFWIEPLLKAAPMELSRAGYGDLLARFVAYGDWYLGFKLGISENYDELAFRLMDVFADPLKQIASEFAQSELSGQAIEISAAALAMAGIAMSLSGETTPLSGYEHVISHALDFLRLNSDRPLVLHGEQVALATLTSAMSFEWLLEIENFDLKKFRSMNEKDTTQIINHFFNAAPFFGKDEDKINAAERKKIDLNLSAKSKPAKEIFISDYLKKSQKWDIAKEKFSDFIQEWPAIKAHLKSLTISSHSMQALLEQARLPIFPEGTNPMTTALEYRWAIRFAPFIRSRFCIADFIFWIGEDCCIAAAT